MCYYKSIIRIGDVMKKKLTGFLMCFVMLCMTLFAGCSLVETDSERYYNAVISEIKTKDGKKVAEITNRELIAGYQSYGSTFVQYGFSNKEAVDETLRLLENKKITVLTAEKLFTLDEIDCAYLWEATANSLNQNLQTYYEEIVPAEAEEASENVKFNEYVPNAEWDIVDGEYVVKAIDKHDRLLDGYTPAVPGKDARKEEDKRLLYSNFLDGLYNENYQKAFNNYLKDLKAAEYGMKLSVDTDSVFMREIDRLYKINYENFMVQKYSEYNRGSATKTDVSAKNILDLYASKVRADYTKYVFEQDSAYDENIQSDVNDVFFVKSGSQDTKFFTVANILFQFTDAQTALYKSYTSKFENQDGSGYTYSQYQADIDALYSQITPIVRQKDKATGEYIEIEAGNLSVEDICDEIEIVLADAQKTGSVNYIGDKINEFIYEYNQDPGMLNAESNYVIGVDNKGNAVSKFVESFNDAGLKLYDNGKGQVGDVAIARSEYGIHLLVYTGACQNLFDGADGNFELSASVESGAFAKLCSTRVNPLVDKTWFDVLYDEIYQDKYSYFESENIKFLREGYDDEDLKYLSEGYEFVVYEGRIPDSLIKN